MTAQERVNRIGLLVAELTRRDHQGDGAASLAEVASRFLTTPEEIKRDIRVLTELDDSADRDWLLALRCSHEGDRITLSSRGPFQRPVRATAAECVALAVGLATEADGRSVPQALREALLPHGVGNPPIALELPCASDVVDVARDAVCDERCLQITYAADNAQTVTSRVIHPHEIMMARGRSFVIAWCELRQDWRRFRADRVLDVHESDVAYRRRAPVPQDLFVPPEDALDCVRVKFLPPAARWLVERFRNVEHGEDGSVIVMYRVANIQWMIREVLQYGDAAEILEPAAYREAMLVALS